MFRFRSLDKIVRDIAQKVEAAHRQPAVADKVENLLAAREETAERMLKLERRRMDIGMGSFLGTYIGLGLLLAGAVTAGFLAAVPTAAAALLASPLFLAGAAVTALAGVTCFATGMSMDPLREDRDVIKRQINRDVLDLVQAAPKEADKSRRYLHSLASIFDAAAEGDKAYAKLVAKVSKKPAVSVQKTPTPGKA